MNYVIINGLKSTYIKGLLIQSLPPISKPLIRTQIEEIDGRDGDVVTTMGYSAYNKELSIGLFGDYNIDEVIGYFNSEGTIIFSNEPDKYYKYQITEQIDFERLIRFKQATVTLHVQPFKYSAVDEVVTFSNNNLRVKDYSLTQNGITITSLDNVISVSGTASLTTYFFVPLRKLNLNAEEYTLQITTEGTNQSACTIRMITSEPTDADSFGNTSIVLSDEGTNTLTSTPSEATAYNYIWFMIAPNIAIDYTMEVDCITENFTDASIVNRGNISAKPKITLYGAGDITLYLNDEQIFIINLGSDEYIVLDAELMNAYKGDTLKNRQVQGNYNDLIFGVGQNDITWSGDVTRIDIDRFTRWL